MTRPSFGELRHAPQIEILREIRDSGEKLEIRQAFVFCFARRNSPGHPGFGARGVRSDAIPGFYKEAFAWTIDFLNQLGMALPQRRTPRNVYIFDLDEAEDHLQMAAPQMASDPLGSSSTAFAVFLPSQRNLASARAEELFMKAAAAHECTHVVCFEQKGFNAVPVGTGWAWLSEGIAEWVALKYVQMTNAGPLQSLEFLSEWFAYPGIPMAHLDEYNSYSWYLSVILVLYLERLADAKAIIDLWKSGSMATDSDPWPKIQSRWGDAVFAELCCDAYFLGDPDNRFYCPEISHRFGPRAWECGYVGTTNGPIEGFVQDFSCRYYAVVPVPGATALTISFSSPSRHVKASLLFADAGYCQVGPCIKLGIGMVSIPLPALSKLDHISLMVTTEPNSSRANSKGHRFEFSFVCLAPDENSSRC